jgi:carboxypeptidase C (cathepsin A)
MKLLGRCMSIVRLAAILLGITFAHTSAHAATPLPADVQTQHNTEVVGERLSYHVVAGTLPLFGAKGEVSANLFYTAYIRDDGRANRPVTFVFNGGPGAASAFLHLGAMGPRVVPFTTNGAAAVQPVRLTDNADTWLGFTDLVFVDPVGTGYSRTVADTEEADNAYFGVDKDADAIASFIRLYLSRTDRDLSPVFLAGESYGGFRSILLAERLLRTGIAVRGLVLISPAIEFSELRASRYAIVPLALSLPSIAATHFETRDGPDAPLDELRDVEQFARTSYLLSLATGLVPNAEVDQRLARYTGLPIEKIKRQGSRVTVQQFQREYREANDQALSSYDGTVSTPLPRNEQIHLDPILDGAVTVLAPAFSQYVRTELGFRTDLQYRLLNRDISARWDFGTAPTRQGFAGSLDELQKARTLRPTLGVLIMHGYTDLVTPYNVSRFLIDQLPPIVGASPIEMRVYRGGHMMYLRPVTRRMLRGDAEAFYGRHVGTP